MRRAGWVAVVVLLLLIAGAGFAVVESVIRSGLSARTPPGRVETAVAHALRSLATPRAMREKRMPMVMDAEMMTAAAHHFADHCASCHGNDGSGETAMGRGMYPRAPDMRLQGTQSLTDGELYSIIHDGIRLSGMPAWGVAEGEDHESWELVAFVRHLPQLTDAEKREMQDYNPQSMMEMKERQQEDDFLNGKASGK